MARPRNTANGKRYLDTISANCDMKTWLIVLLNNCIDASRFRSDLSGEGEIEVKTK